MKHLPISLATACAVAILAAGCGGGSHSGANASRLSLSAGDRDFLEFASCVRSHGVSITDPFHRPGHTGLTLSFPSPSPAATAAEHACQHFIEAVINMKEAHAQALTASIRLPLIRFAECMRSHGIPLQDPDATGQLNLAPAGGPDAGRGPGRYSPVFHTADQACRHLLPAGVPDNGTGP
jgi:hypothetical protein